MNKNSNAYTFIFAIAMVLVVAITLAFTAQALQPIQRKNVKQEKMQRILFTTGLDSVEVDGKKTRLSRAMAQKYFKKYVTKQVALDNQGNELDDVNAFKVDLAKEINKDVDKQAYPLYVVEVEGEEFYVIPLRGSGLWDAIWGYVALKGDLNTVKGAVFDHKGETAGLGAEITKTYFQKSFENEKIMDKNGNFVGVTVEKGYQGGTDKDDNAVNAISGATVTGDGVSDMIEERIKHYLPYFKTQTNVKTEKAEKQVASGK
jgi:Na+-transporting NADH:ubiquinone oxidoreductase subunit C